MAALDELFDEIDSHHTSEPCSNTSEIDSFSTAHNYSLPDDLIAFYRRYRWVKLFAGRHGDSQYRFVPISEIHPTRLDVYGKDSDEYGPGTWLSVCDVLDGNYIAIDLASRNGTQANYIDCFHETFAIPGESRIIARSFTELLEHALQSSGSLYYLEKGFSGYGDGRPLTAENAAIRIDGPKAPHKGWLVKFYIPSKRASHNEFFKDSKYGGKEKALEAVRRYIEKSTK